MSGVTGCKLAKLGWNKIDNQEFFTKMFIIYFVYFSTDFVE